MTNSFPVVTLFAFRRPDLLGRTLEALRLNGVSRVRAFSDGPRDAGDADSVAAVRHLLAAVDWAEVRIVARDRNLGLGASIVDGVTDVLAEHDATIVCEDDLVAVPGAVAWLAAALARYRDDERVLSVSAWTHPRVTPRAVGERPYFSARVNTLFWGTWARAWRGMDTDTAADRLAAYAARGGDPAAYGADLPRQAAAERTRNIWAVRFIAQHLAAGGLSLCPPWTMVRHIGYEPRATNAVRDPTWDQPAPTRVVPIPETWPVPVEHPEMARLWRDAVAVELQSGRGPGILRRALAAAGSWLRR